MIHLYRQEKLVMIYPWRDGRWPGSLGRHELPLYGDPYRRIFLIEDPVHRAQVEFRKMVQNEPHLPGMGITWVDWMTARLKENKAPAPQVDEVTVGDVLEVDIVVDMGNRKAVIAVGDRYDLHVWDRPAIDTAKKWSHSFDTMHKIWSPEIGQLFHSHYQEDIKLFDAVRHTGLLVGN